ncbi:hypothetical protein [Psychrobacter sp.]|uniref:hypothetical protein n=1 Tax=Psychrobacter sp. TaxID=56811 RepID=UPI003566E1D5
MIKQVKFADYQDEITAMMMDMLHLEPQTVDIPVQRYIELDEMGVLRPMLWFDGDTVKALVLLFVSPSLRNPMIVDAATDVLWIKPEHRGNSQALTDGIKDYLSSIGVSYWYAASRASHPIDGYLEKNNFTLLERMYYCEVQS